MPHAVLATSFVMLLPAALVAAVVPAGHPALLLVSVPLAVAVSVAASLVGAAVWKRRPRSRDLIFADLMLWGWLRRYRTERRLAEARTVLGPGADAKGLSAERKVEALTQLSGLLEARDAYTHGHSRRVTRHAERIARAMHLSATEVAQVRTAAALHDVGKVHTPREILNKPDRLTEAEFAVIKRHPGDGADMLAGIDDAEITAMVRHHHERLDGAGYPHGLAGEEIPLGARIIAVADTFDAMTSSRSYRRASSHRKALEVLSRESGSQLDARAVSAFLAYYSGSRSVAWSALAAAAPQRFFGWLGGATQGLGSGAATVAQTLPAIGAAALLAGTGAPALPFPASQATQREAVVADASAPPIAASAPLDEAARDRRRSVRREAVELPARRTPRVRTRARTPGASEPGSAQPAPGATSPSRPDGKPQAPGGSSIPIPDTTPNPTPVPGAELPPVEAPQLPDVELPKVDLPVELGSIELPAIELPPIQLPSLELPELPTLA